MDIYSNRCLRRSNVNGALCSSLEHYLQKYLLERYCYFKRRPGFQGDHNDDWDCINSISSILVEKRIPFHYAWLTEKIQCIRVEEEEDEVVLLLISMISSSYAVTKVKIQQLIVLHTNQRLDGQILEQ